MIGAAPRQQGVHGAAAPPPQGGRGVQLSACRESVGAAAPARWECGGRQPPACKGCRGNSSSLRFSTTLIINLPTGMRRSRGSLRQIRRDCGFLVISPVAAAAALVSPQLQRTCIWFRRNCGLVVSPRRRSLWRLRRSVLQPFFALLVGAFPCPGCAHPNHDLVNV